MISCSEKLTFDTELYSGETDSVLKVVSIIIKDDSVLKAGSIDNKDDLITLAKGAIIVMPNNKVVKFTQDCSLKALSTEKEFLKITSTTGEVSTYCVCSDFDYPDEAPTHLLVGDSSY